LSRVAGRYGKALFQIALEKNKLDVVARDFELISQVSNENVDFRKMLINPLIPAMKKADIISKLFKDKTDQLTFNFLKLLCTKKRSEFLLEVIDNFKVRILDHEGVLTGQIISATPLSQDQVQDIHNKITSQSGRKVQLSQEIDKDLMGGFIVKVKDRVIDLSVRNQLDKLRNKLVFG
jgi:F-type H+-transporting ATPase subunit delta